jgi:hypothetical protein
VPNYSAVLLRDKRNERLRIHSQNIDEPRLLRAAEGSSVQRVHRSAVGFCFASDQHEIRVRLGQLKPPAAP